MLLWRSRKVTDFAGVGSSLNCSLYKLATIELTFWVGLCCFKQPFKYCRCGGLILSSSQGHPPNQSDTCPPRQGSGRIEDGEDCGFLKMFSQRCHHLGWPGSAVPYGGAAGAGWNWPCLAWDRPSCSSQRPCWSPHCQHLGTNSQCRGYELYDSPSILGKARKRIALICLLTQTRWGG